MAEITKDINKHETRASLAFSLFMGFLFATIIAAPVITYIFDIVHSIKGLEVLAVASFNRFYGATIYLRERAIDSRGAKKQATC